MKLKLRLQMRNQVGRVCHPHAVPAQSFKLDDESIFEVLFALGVHGVLIILVDILALDATVWPYVRRLCPLSQY